MSLELILSSIPTQFGMSSAEDSNTSLSNSLMMNNVGLVRKEIEDYFLSFHRMLTPTHALEGNKCSCIRSEQRFFQR